MGEGEVYNDGVWERSSYNIPRKLKQYASIYTGWPPPPPKKKKTEQSIQSLFQDFAVINIYLFSPCWIEHLFLIVITPRSLNLVENFLFYE